MASFLEGFATGATINDKIQQSHEATRQAQQVTQENDQKLFKGQRELDNLSKLDEAVMASEQPTTASNPLTGTSTSPQALEQSQKPLDLFGDYTKLQTANNDVSMLQAKLAEQERILSLASRAGEGDKFKPSYEMTKSKLDAAKATQIQLATRHSDRILSGVNAVINNDGANYELFRAGFIEDALAVEQSRGEQDLAAVRAFYEKQLPPTWSKEAKGAITQVATQFQNVKDQLEINKGIKDTEELDHKARELGTRIQVAKIGADSRVALGDAKIGSNTTLGLLKAAQSDITGLQIEEARLLKLDLTDPDISVAYVDVQNRLARQRKLTNDLTAQLELDNEMSKVQNKGKGKTTPPPKPTPVVGSTKENPIILK